jgi:hypothetical protein
LTAAGAIAGRLAIELQRDKLPLGTQQRIAFAIGGRARYPAVQSVGRIRSGELNEAKYSRITVIPIAGQWQLGDRIRQIVYGRRPNGFGWPDGIGRRIAVGPVSVAISVSVAIGRSIGSIEAPCAGRAKLFSHDGRPGAELRRSVRFATHGATKLADNVRNGWSVVAVSIAGADAIAAATVAGIVAATVTSETGNGSWSRAGTLSGVSTAGQSADPPTSCGVCEPTA